MFRFRRRFKIFRITTLWELVQQSDAQKAPNGESYNRSDILVLGGIGSNSSKTILDRETTKKLQ